MELRDLAYFQAIAETGHLGRAAEQLGRTQPALTKCIRRLESELNASLFERSGRGLRLTPIGEALLIRTKQLRNNVEMAVREVRDVARGSVGHVRLGSGATTTEYLLPSLYSTMLKETPEVTMELIIGMNDVLRASLRKGYLDLVIGPLAEVDIEFCSVPALEDRVVVVARAGHPLFNKRAKMGELLNYRWVLPGPHVATRKWLDHAFTSNGLQQPDVQIETSSISLLPRMIAHTDLLSFISVRNLGEGRVGSPLREIALPETTMSRWLGAVYRQDVYLSPACQRMIEIIKAMPKSNPLPKPRRVS